MAILRRPDRVRRGAGLLALALGLALMGCGAMDEPTPDSKSPRTSSTSVEPTPTPTPTAKPTSPAEPEPAEPTSAEPTTGPTALVVSTAGLGPLTVGLPPETNPGAALIALDPQACSEDAMWSGEGDPGRWSATTEPEMLDGWPRPLFRVAAADVVEWIDVVSPTLATESGIHVGSTAADLLAAYPDLVEGTAGPVSRVWWVTDDAGTLVFETQDDRDGLQPTGTPETVILMRVLAPGIDPDFATANSGWTADACG